MYKGQVYTFLIFHSGDQSPPLLILRLASYRWHIWKHLMPSQIHPHPQLPMC